MQMQSQGLTLADIPMGFFPDDAFDAPATTRMAPKPAPLADAPPATPTGPKQSRILRIVRAKTGETELSLQGEQDGTDAIRYVIVKSAIAPYTRRAEALVGADGQTSLNYQQALAEFDRRVALAYPPEKLSNNKHVAIHDNIL